jgi:hypothetical protein
MHIQEYVIKKNNAGNKVQYYLLKIEFRYFTDLSGKFLSGTKKLVDL